MPKKQRGNRKDQAVVIGDSQVKYLRQGNLTTTDEKIDYLNDKLYDMCKTLNLKFVRNDNISVSNLSRDGLHLNRSGQSKLAANLLNVLS